MASNAVDGLVALKDDYMAAEMVGGMADSLEEISVDRWAKKMVRTKAETSATMWLARQLVGWLHRVLSAAQWVYKCFYLVRKKG